MLQCRSAAGRFDREDGRDRLGHPPRLALRRNDRDLDLRLDQDLVAPQNTLMEHDPRAPEQRRARLDAEHLVDPRRSQKIDIHVPDDEGHGLAIEAVRQFLVADPLQAQEIAPSPLQEMKETRVIDDAGEIRVLEIDAHEKPVAEPGQFARNEVIVGS